MHSSDEDETERHPINAVLAKAATIRALGPKKLDTGLHTGEREHQQLEPGPAANQDVSGSPSPSRKARKKAKKKASKTPSPEIISIEEDESVSMDISIGHGEDVPAVPSRPATAPPDLAAVRKACTEAAGKGRAGLPNVIFVEDKADIVQGIELRRLTKAPRYFDDDVGLPEVSSKRCFNCGQMGHFASGCTNAARQKPCHLCAQLGHDGFNCPNKLCFRCGAAGHEVRDCKRGSATGWESASQMCNRCGSTDSCPCVGKGDYFRYEGGCTGSYSKSDLSSCRCYVCGKIGHLCCKQPPTDPPFKTSCYNCGSNKHLGEECPDDHRAHLLAERRGDVEKARNEREREQQDYAARASAGRGGGGGRGGGQHMQRSHSVPQSRHSRWGDDDDDDEPVAAVRSLGSNGHRDRNPEIGRDSDRYASAPRYNDRAPIVAVGAYQSLQASAAAPRAVSRFANAPAPGGWDRYSDAGAQPPQYNGDSRRSTSVGVAQYSQQPHAQLQQQQQQYVAAPEPKYGDRARSAGAYAQFAAQAQQQRYGSAAPYTIAGTQQQRHASSQPQYGGTQQQQYAGSQQQQYGGGTQQYGSNADYGRSRQSTTHQQQQARRETDTTRSQLARHGGGQGQKRPRYHDDDDDYRPASRRK